MATEHELGASADLVAGVTTLKKWSPYFHIVCIALGEYRW